MAQCPRCGASYDEEPGLASCPACLLRLGLEAPEAEGEAPTEPAAAPGTAPGEPMPERIGDFTVVELLGTGGMGAVYLAEQREPIHRRVAVKVIKAGLCTPEVLARFEAEREALALMSHPAIAAVLDAGTTDDGRPFVVMEYVPGIRITDYCDRHRLDLRHRLELFREVCSAVQHAHQKGIVHRDLKPNNVLVAEDDGQPRVKVIDFGLAKALHGRLTDVTLVTQFGMLLGTPAYMSPEQVQPSPLDVDTRTDVYSLGVLLYELLTGALPFDPAGVREEAVAELRHLLLELEPTRPSQRLQALGSDAVELAQHRNTDVGSLQRLLRDDLDWIVLRALERDRSRRYQSASELAADIDRHLRHEPVSAGPPSALYRIRKLARRHRTTAVAGALAVVALVSGAIVSGVLFVRAEQARREADGHRRVAEWRGYVAEIAAADASLRIGSVAEARRHLDLCPEAARGWEWRHLAMRTDASFLSSHVEGGRIEAVAETATGEIACVVVPPVYDEQHCASLWLFDPARDTWRRAALQESVLTVSPDGARAVTTPWWFGGELGSNAPPTAPVPASERGLLRLVDTNSLAPQATFLLRDAGRWTQPADRAGPEPYYFLMDPVLVMNDLNGDPIRALEGRYPETVSAVISPDGTLMAAWSWDNAIQLWDLANGRVAGRLAGHRDGIIEVAIAAGGGRVASSSWDRTLRVWDHRFGRRLCDHRHRSLGRQCGLQPGRSPARVGRSATAGSSSARPPIPPLQRATRLTAEPSGRSPSAPTARSWRRAGWRAPVRLWRTDPLQPLGELRGHLGPVTALAFADEGRVVAAGSEIGDLRLFSVGRTPMRSFGDRPVGRSEPFRRRHGTQHRPHGATGLWSARTRWCGPGTRQREGDLAHPPSAALLRRVLVGRDLSVRAPKARSTPPWRVAQPGDPIPALRSAMYGELSADGSWLALAVGNEVQLWHLPDAGACRHDCALLATPHRGRLQAGRRCDPHRRRGRRRPGVQHGRRSRDPESKFRRGRPWGGLEPGRRTRGPAASLRPPRGRGRRRARLGAARDLVHRRSGAREPRLLRAADAGLQRRRPAPCRAGSRWSAWRSGTRPPAPAWPPCRGTAIRRPARPSAPTGHGCSPVRPTDASASGTPQRRAAAATGGCGARSDRAGGGGVQYAGRLGSVLSAGTGRGLEDRTSDFRACRPARQSPSWRSDSRVTAAASGRPCSTARSGSGMPRTGRRTGRPLEDPPGDRCGSSGTVLSTRRRSCMRARSDDLDDSQLNVHEWQERRYRYRRLAGGRRHPSHLLF